MSANHMDEQLHSFLADRRPCTVASIDWGNMPLRVASYIGPDLPPIEYVTSVRALVFKDGSILVVHNRDERHIVPGGRREPDESLEETLRREVLEETGMVLEEPVVLGFLHFENLGPLPEARPDDYLYPYPHFLQVVYRAEAGEHRPEARVHDPFVTGSEFVPVEMARELDLSPGERVFLEVAVGSAD
jgi:ADP-ribose pyrophosphatase YjhB (NUDIX family)